MTGPERADDRPDRVLTVCLGNICRSPTAEAAIVEAAHESGLRLEVASAGTGDWHIGHPPDPSMRAAAQDAGLMLRGTAQQVDADLLAWADLVVVMDRQNLADVRLMAERAGITTPVRLFRDFDPELIGTPDVASLPEDAPAGTGPSRAYAADEVPDPYGGGPEGFEEVVRICRRTARSIVANWSGRKVAG
jgi:protein-tyrosine phosphatase